MKIKLYCACGRWREYSGDSKEKIVSVFGDAIKAFRLEHATDKDHKIFTTRKAATEEKHKRSYRNGN